MNKIIAIGFIIAGSIISCQKEEITPTEPITAISKDCNCNRVVDVKTFNKPDGTPMYCYSTINDCTGFQQNKGFQYNKVVIGQCK